MAGKFGTGLAAAGGAIVGSLAGAFVGQEMREKNAKMWGGALGTLLGAFGGAALLAATPETTCTTTTGAGKPKGLGAPRGFGAGGGFFNRVAMTAQTPQAQASRPNTDGHWFAVPPASVPIGVKRALFASRSGQAIVGGVRWAAGRGSNRGAYFRWVPAAPAYAAA
jgi:hypothetical protein